MTYDASNRKDVRRAEKDSRLQARQEAEVVTQIMATAAGRRWVFERLASAAVFQTSFVPADPYTTAFNEGQRNQGLMLLAQVMAHCPDQFTLAQQEANVRDTATEQPRGEDADGRDQGPDAAGDDRTGD